MLAGLTVLLSEWTFAKDSIEIILFKAVAEPVYSDIRKAPAFIFALSANPTKWSNTLKTICQQFADKLFEYV